jgi:hypothetical protein
VRGRSDDIAFMKRRSLPLLALLLLFNTAASALEPVLVVTPRAQVLPVSATNRPFLAAGQALQRVDLPARGYVESELRVSGRAKVYDWAPAGDAVTPRADAPYVTRILVRQPKDAARFSGRVIVELLDAAAGYDSAPLWGLSWDYFMKHGDAWVGVTVQPAAAAALRRFDGVRYAAMSLGVAQPESCNASGAGSPLAWDALAQVGALLRSSSKENPLLALNPQRFIAAGYGQSGGYVITFANALHAWQRLGDGAPIFDGYLSAVATHAAPVNPCAPALAADDAHAGVQPRDVPFVMVLAGSAAQAATPLRDDSDAPGDVFRLYKVADVENSAAYAAGQPAAADLKIAGLPVPAVEPCGEPRTGFPATLALNAIWQQYDDLLQHQLPMNKEPRDVPNDARSRQTCGAGIANAHPH